jgi:hypothetical protein
VALLRLHRQRRDRPRLEALQRDRLAGLLAIAIGAVVDAGDRLVDLGDQLALAVARAQFDRAIGLRRRPVGDVGMIDVLVLKLLKRALRLLQNVFLPGEELGAEIFALPLIHERLFFRRPVGLQLVQSH